MYIGRNGHDKRNTNNGDILIVYPLYLFSRAKFFKNFFKKVLTNVKNESIIIDVRNKRTRKRRVKYEFEKII